MYPDYMKIGRIIDKRIQRKIMTLKLLKYFSCLFLCTMIYCLFAGPVLNGEPYQFSKYSPTGYVFFIMYHITSVLFAIHVSNKRW